MHARDMNPPYKFCAVCGRPLEPRVLKVTEPKRLVCTGATCGFVFYLDPKIAVGTVIRANQGRQLVLVRRAIEPGYGKWVFPGGYVDRGEEVHAAAVREAREEAGFEVRLERLLNVYSYPGGAPVIIVYEASIVGGEFLWDDESLEGRFFHAHEIPWDDLAFRSTREALLEFLKKT